MVERKPRRGFRRPFEQTTNYKLQYMSTTTTRRRRSAAAPSAAAAAAIVSAAAPTPARKLSIATMTLEQFALYGEGMAGGFCRFDCKRNKAGILTSARLEVPRFRGESFATFVGYFTGSLPEGVRLEKPTLDVLRDIFHRADEAASAFGAEAARVTFSYGKRGLRIDATSYRA